MRTLEQTGMMKASIPIPHRQPMPSTTESTIKAATQGMMRNGKKEMDIAKVRQRALDMSEMIISFRMFVPVCPIE